jgi:hypothetical protein
MIRVQLPAHLRTLAHVDGEAKLEIEGAVTQRSVLDAREAKYPALRGTIRDQVTQKRRPFLRLFACAARRGGTGSGAAGDPGCHRRRLIFSGTARQEAFASRKNGPPADPGHSCGDQRSATSLITIRFRNVGVLRVRGSPRAGPGEGRWGYRARSRPFQGASEPAPSTNRQEIDKSVGQRIGHLAQLQYGLVELTGIEPVTS